MPDLHYYVDGSQTDRRASFSGEMNLETVFADIMGLAEMNSFVPASTNSFQ